MEENVETRAKNFLVKTWEKFAGLAYLIGSAIRAGRQLGRSYKKLSKTNNCYRFGISISLHKKDNSLSGGLTIILDMPMLC